MGSALDRRSGSVRRLLSAAGKRFPALRRLVRKSRPESDKVRFAVARLRGGLEQRALADLNRYFMSPGDPATRARAAWELALWHAGASDAAAASEALGYLDYLTAQAAPRMPVERIALLRTELLLRLGRLPEARTCCLAALERAPTDDLLLAAANVVAHASEASVGGRVQRDRLQLDWINRVFVSHELEPLDLLRPEQGMSLDNLTAQLPAAERVGDGPLVSVIMACHNSAAYMETAIRSVLEQSWRNLELFLVDDGSSDNTLAIARAAADQDARVRVMRLAQNRGPYSARNEALREAAGEFVTLHDADDWSHPRKLQVQVEALLKAPRQVANRSLHARVTTGLVVARRGNPGYYICSNMSSLMFRRRPVLERIGYWDCVRMGGDSEYIGRLKAAFGADSIGKAGTGPLSFLRQHGQSLTAAEATGFHGYFFGARKEYKDAFVSWHRAAVAEGRSLRLSYPASSTPFYRPYLLRADGPSTGERRFDVVLASDFRVRGGTIVSSIEEIRAQQAMGLKTALVQLSRYEASASEICPEIRAMLENGEAELLTYGEAVAADLVIFRYPPALNEEQRYLPRVRTRHLRVICNQPPLRVDGEHDASLYDPVRVHENARRVFGAEPVWHPIGPVARRGLMPWVERIPVADEDWVNLINPAEWWRGYRKPAPGNIVIGRHARDHRTKWPEDAKALLQAYPDAADISVDILGGAGVPAALLGGLPRNWKVASYGAEDPREYLARLDVFVFFPHSRRLEAFGRSMLEAMAAGVPVILPFSFSETFGDAALYAEPDAVGELVRRLAADERFYRERVDAGLGFVQDRYSWAEHRKRLLALSVPSAAAVAPQPEQV